MLPLERTAHIPLPPHPSKTEYIYERFHSEVPKQPFQWDPLLDLNNPDNYSNQIPVPANQVLQLILQQSYALDKMLPVLLLVDNSDTQEKQL